MRKRWLWGLTAIVLGVALYMFTGSPLSNNDHTMLALGRLDFLPAMALVLLNKIVRKAAHLLVYAFMAICLRNALYPWRWTYPAAWLLTTLYGASDEFHQIYVWGRTPLFTDVLIDSLGAAIALFIIYWSHRKRRRRLYGSQTS
ncbi:MAG: VanZ family protein [Syntrophomonadaceae bacterium]|nr:VanZ family protein [Syntrophomonadaceae bacterium]